MRKKKYICVYDILGNLCDKKSYVSFDKIKEHFETKLKKLALIKASKKILNDKCYFRYYYLDIYSKKSFKTFLKLLEDGVIVTSLIGRINKSGKKVGNYANKNLVFQINKNELNKLFDIIYFNDFDNLYDNDFSVVF